MEAAAIIVNKLYSLSKLSIIKYKVMLQSKIIVSLTQNMAVTRWGSVAKAGVTRETYPSHNL